MWYPSMHCKWYPSMPCSRSPGGRGWWYLSMSCRWYPSMPCKSPRGFSRPTLRGEVEGSGQGGLQAHTWGGSPVLQAHTRVMAHTQGSPGPHLGGGVLQAHTHVSRPTPGGFPGSPRGVSWPTPKGGVSRPTPRGVCRLTPRWVYPSMH